jgi:NTP pyrophosphatase (non-canonical NTP hydrolase)
MPKTLKEMQAEVTAYCEEKGWRESPCPLGQAMALLHEEAAEAGHAWRDWGLEDVTERLGVGLNPKPQGVGSEFADVLIRLLDDADLFGWDLEECLEPDEEIFVLDDEFLVNINTLHGLIARVTMAQEASYESPSSAFAGILSFLRQLCKLYGIDLMAEYERKMAYNRTRDYRHGGRRA